MQRSFFILVATAALLPCAQAWGQPSPECVTSLHAADLPRVSADLTRLTALADTSHSEPFVLLRAGQAVRIDTCAAPASLRRLASQGSAGSPGMITVLPVDLLLLGNSAYPQPALDGALWNGRGINAGITTGVALRWRWLSAAVAPVFTWQSNASFDHPATSDTARSVFSHPYLGSWIDVPVRFGDGAFTTIDAGASYLRLDVGPIGIGASNEQIVWGPSIRNPLMLSGAAPGFPHAFVETPRATDIWIGRLTAQMFWGQLDESEYFDNDPDNDERLLAGLLIALQPRGLDGLSIGGGRLYSATLWPELSFWDVAREAYVDVGSNPQGARSGDNQLLGLFFRWVSAESGLEVFGEWAREDHWEGSRGLLVALDASQAWSLGFQKLIRRDANAWRVHAETIHLGDAVPFRTEWRGPMSFYAHSQVRQGHTQRGQILGAPVGTGGESQYLRIDRIGGRGMTGLSLERARYEDEAYASLYADAYGSSGRDTELSLRLSHMTAVGPALINAELGWSRRYNRNFLGLDGAAAPARVDDNLSLRIGARAVVGGTR